MDPIPFCSDEKYILTLIELGFGRFRTLRVEKVFSASHFCPDSGAFSGITPMRMRWGWEGSTGWRSHLKL